MNTVRPMTRAAVGTCGRQARGWACRVMALAVCAMLVAGASPAAAQVTSWFDDFNDGNATDGSPMTWDPNPHVTIPLLGIDEEPFLGTYDASSGDYFLAGEDQQFAVNSDEEILLADASETDFFGGVSVRTRVKLDDLGGVGVTANAIFPTFVGYYGILRISKDGAGDVYSSYEVGRIDPINGFIKFVDDETPDDPNNPGTGLYPPQTPPEFDPNQDMIVQLDVFDDQLSYTVWSADDPQPQPIFTVADDSGLPFLTEGSAGISMVEDSFNGAEQGTATFRWAKAASVRILDGDMDLDGDVDFDDIEGFVLGLTDAPGYEASLGLSSVVMGDIDHDGDLDFDDIGGLVGLLASGGARSVPEPTTLILFVAGLAALPAVRRRRR